MSGATGSGAGTRGHDPAPGDARSVALEALVRIDGGAYANLVLPPLLERSRLSSQDRNFATELVYGATRMRRACDWLVDRFVLREPDARTRAALRLGAYQLQFLKTPPHAAVSATVSVSPARTRGLVNAVLRRVAASGSPDASGADQAWPSEAVRLSYPDWVVDRLARDLGSEAWRTLEAMNQPASASLRDDGYVQDPASRWVVDAVDVRGTERVVDLCAAPGGKATGLAAAGAGLVVASDIRPSRVGLIVANAARLGATTVAPMVADGTTPPLRPNSVQRVLVDAPCSGLGVLRRRPDARWRITEADVADLVDTQRRLLDAAATVAAEGGLVVYSVCTLTDAETIGVDEWLAGSHPELVACAPSAPQWRPHGRGGRVLPHDSGTDGMFLLRLRKSAAAPSLD